MENKLNFGALFKNENKTKDIQPDYKGSANVNGVEMDMGVWIRTSQAGKKYMSVKFSQPYFTPMPEEAPNRVEIPVKPVVEDDFINDDIPW